MYLIKMYLIKIEDVNILSIENINIIHYTYMYVSIIY